MFTGIIETIGIISDIKKDQGNVHLTIQTNITNELKIDQSVAHNGVCLTVVEIFDNKHVVTAIQETINKTTSRISIIYNNLNLNHLTCLFCMIRFFVIKLVSIQ